MVIVKHFYNHDNEVNRLNEDMLFFNQYYSILNVNNLWFDTFNHHNYLNNIDNMIEPNSTSRDMLSSIALLNGFTERDTKYHFSSWKVDSDRVKFLIDKGCLNPISSHPTKKGHEIIADLIDKELEKII